MARTATVRVQMAPELKADAERVLSALGLSPSTAITQLYQQIVRHQAVPFWVGIPNATTSAAMGEAEAGAVTRARSPKELFAGLDADN